MIDRRHLLVIAVVGVGVGAIYLARSAGPRAVGPGSSAPGARAPTSAAPAPLAPSPPAPRGAALDPPALDPAAAAPAATVEPAVTIVDDPALPATDAELRAVADWLAQRRGEWALACWPAATLDRPRPEPATVRLRAVFEADGRVRAHGFSIEALPDVARCLDARPFEPPFTGRGQRVDLALRFALP